MQVLVPATSLVEMDEGAGVGVREVVMGPLGPDVYVSFVRVDWDCEAAQNLRWVGALSAAPEATEPGLRAGRSVVTASVVRLGGVPAVQFRPVAAERGCLVLPVGLRVSWGAGWFVWRWETGIAVTTRVTVGIGVQRLEAMRE